ncbi:SDR family oxidoreductase [Humibacter ginsenosidimutans]|uniref:NAD-dependent epimerase/dehydratase family protein n=1 Tax=Humibacter ginsenosidimutans TaxID=2599293 RepID=A0A5B8M5C9_9MICO|nr:NAD(P)H-binding protein [Humibacter ginsenosidimutans]QDZ15506.1 NAD-dependent epimerase/dehydratase family protein [Humibacter ginsenosidimutans]
MTILVTGATGAVGRHLVSTLLEHGSRVRAVTRAPEKAALPPEVEVVAADLGDPGTLGDAVFAGIDRAFVFPADGVDRFVEAASGAGIDRFTVLSSLAAAKEFPRDEGSASQLHHAAIESAVTSCTDEWTILRPGTFANNLLSWAWPIKNDWPIRAPYLASAQAPIHEADVAEAAAATLLSTDWVGQAIPLTGPQALTRTEQVDAIGAGIGRELHVIEIAPEEFRADMAQYVPESIITMILDYWSDTVTEPDLPRPVTAVTGRPGRTLEQWAHDHRADFAPVAAS